MKSSHVILSLVLLAGLISLAQARGVAATGSPGRGGNIVWINSHEWYVSDPLPPLQHRYPASGANPSSGVAANAVQHKVIVDPPMAPAAPSPASVAACGIAARLPVRFGNKPAARGVDRAAWSCTTAQSTHGRA